MTILRNRVDWRCHDILSMVLKWGKCVLLYPGIPRVWRTGQSFKTVVLSLDPPTIVSSMRNLEMGSHEFHTRVLIVGGDETREQSVRLRVRGGSWVTQPSRPPPRSRVTKVVQRTSKTTYDRTLLGTRDGYDGKSDCFLKSVLSPFIMSR